LAEYLPSPQTEDCWKRVVDAYRPVFGEELRALVAHGSSVIGGSISGWSDFDVTVLLGPKAFGRTGLALDKALAAQAAVDSFGVLEAGYTYYSCSFYNADRLPAEWPGFFRGAYRLLHGELAPEALATEESARVCSEGHLRNAADFLATEAAIFAETHDARVPGKDAFARLRWLRTEVKHLMFSTVALATGQALDTWALDKFEVLERFKKYSPGPASYDLQRFFDILCDLGPTNHDVAKVKEACVLAFRFVEWCSSPVERSDTAIA
jgi:hypothetical protein